MRRFLAVVTLLAGLSLLPSATASAAVGPCTDVQIIGLRGSGEPLNGALHDMGILVGPVADQIAEQVQGAGTVSFHGVPYPAGDASWKTVLSTSYFNSEREGVGMLYDYLREAVAACPSMKLVVIGYSQGAHAVGDELAKEPSSITDHIGAVVLLADPRFNPGVSYAFGSFDPRDHGIAGARSSADFSSYSSKVFSFCRQNDLVCQGIGIHHSADEHAQVKYLADYGELIAGLVRRKLGYPRPASATTPLDLAFVIDSTGSMGSSIRSVASAAQLMAQKLKNRGADFRVGLVDFKDTDQGDPYGARVDAPMSNDITGFSAALDGLQASGGGDGPEAVFDGIMTAINGLTWRHVPRKAIIVMGDAPAKDPEPITGYTHQSVLAAARALDPAIINSVAVGSGPLSDFQTLADGSGGNVFTASDASEVSDQILAAVDQAAVPLTVVLNVATGRPGTPISFSAGGSFYDAGDITSYDWDFDGDGVADQTTTSDRTTHVFAAPFDGIASVTAHTDDGHQGTITAEVHVTADAPTTASAPHELHLTADATSVTATWSAPADLGGGSVAGYSVRLVDADGDVASASTDPDVMTQTFDDLDEGAYTVAVTAVTEAGEGAPTTGSATVKPAGPTTWPFTGFLAPTANPPAVNTAYAGWPVVLRFGVGSDRGLGILATGSPSSQAHPCNKPAAVGAASGADGRLYYHAKTSHYIYVWKTAPRWANTCRTLTVTLTDGSVHQAEFRFRQSGAPPHKHKHKPCWGRCPKPPHDHAPPHGHAPKKHH